jgi:hemolysin III
MSTRLFKDPVSGFSHALGLLFALIGSVWLVLRARDGATLTIFGVYAACLVSLYAASSLYHLIIAGERVSRALRLFDHVAIFLFVAGTSTPLLFRALDGATRIKMLSAMWGLAAVGIALKLLWRSAPRVVYTAMYVAMGWSVVAVGGPLLRGLSPACFACVVGGGLVYTMGAVVYAVKWPNPRPPVVGFHEVWHFFVLGGSALHFAAIAQLPG